MGSALYISIKGKPSALDTEMDGRALARAWEALNPIAEKLEVPNLDKLCTTAWKSPDKGLPVFEKYLAYVVEHPDCVPNAKDVIEDIKDVLRLIGEASKLGTKWRLLLDY
jgi:hypothetical protein